MTEQQYKDATEINKQIEKINNSLKQIDRLIKSDSVFCNIDMPKKSTYERLISSYHSANSELIKKILDFDKIKLERDKSILEDKLKEI